MLVVRLSQFGGRRPSMLNLHGVTGAMAIDNLVDHLPPARHPMMLKHIRAEPAVMYRGIDPNIPEAATASSDE